MTAETKIITGPFWISSTTAVLSYRDADNNLRYSRTTDGASHWQEIIEEEYSLLRVIADSIS